MLIGPAGEVYHPTYVPPPPPPPPPPKPSQKQIQTLQSTANSAQSRYNQDSATLRTERAALAANQSGSGGNGKFIDEERDAQTSALGSEISTQQAQVNADKTALTTAQQNLSAAKAVLRAAAAYKPTAPKLTVSNPVTRAVAPVLKKAQGDRATAQTSVNNDQSALTATQAAIQAEDNNPDLPGMGSIKHALALQQQLARQQKQLKADQQTVVAANAKVAAANSVLYGQQVGADQHTLSAQFKTLYAEGIINAKGQLNVPASKLIPAQQTAYDNYISTATQLGADDAAFGQSRAQLQVYASDTKQYGAIASNAVSAVNSALKPLRLQFQGPAAIDPKQAQANLTVANQQVVYADAQWNAATAQTAYDQANQNLTQVLSGNPADLSKLLPQAQTAAYRAQGALDQASGYLQTLQEQSAVSSDQSQLTQAQATYNANPNAVNANALYDAQLKLDQDTQQLGIAQSGFYAGTAEVLAAPQYGSVTAAEQEANLAQQALQKQENPGNACVAASPTLVKNVNTTQAALSKALATPTPALLVAQNWESYTNLLSANYGVWEANNAVPVSGTATGASSADVLSQAQIQQKVAQYDYAHSSFELVQPSNLVNPQTQADESAANSAWDAYAGSQHLTLSDSNIAAQLQQLAPGSKADVAVGEKEIEQELTEEKQILADRSMLEQWWDGEKAAWTGNNSPPQTQSYLDGKLQALQALNADESKMSTAAYNQRYLAIMGNVSTQFDGLSQSQIHNSQNWDQAQQVMVDVAAAAATIAVTAATGGVGGVLVGAALGFETSQVAATAQNYVTASEGGNVEANSQVSLAAAWSNNFGYGGDSHQEKTQSLVDGGVDALTSLGNAVGVEAGGALGTAASMRVLPTVLSKFGVEGLTLVPEDASADTVASIVKANMDQSIWMRAGSGAIGMTGNQAITGGTQVLTTGINVAYQESEGNISSAQGTQQMNQAFEGALLGLATAPIVGAVSGAMPHFENTGVNLAVQGATNLTTNFALTAGSDALLGQRFTTSDLVSVLANSMSMSAVDAILHGDTHAPPESDGILPLRTTPGSGAPEGSSWGPELSPGGALRPGSVGVERTSALGADYHPQPTWELSPETRSELAAILEKWNATGGPPVSLEGFPRISLPSGEPPDMPSRIPEQVYRTVRMDLEERLAPLPLVRYQNSDWEVSGAHGDGIVLRAVGTRNRIVVAHDLIGTTAEDLDFGTSWHTGPGDSPDTLSLIDPATGEVQRQIPAASLPDTTLVFSSPPSENGGTEATKWVPVAVDSDPNAGSSRVQLQRLDVPAFEKKVPHSELEAPVLVRLKGKEREGAFSLTYAQGQWIASRGNEEFPVSADAVIGDYQDFPAYAFDRFTLRTTNRQFWDEQTGASANTGVTHPDVPTALAASNLGTVPEDQVDVRAAVGSEHLETHVNFIRALEEDTPLFIRQIKVEDGTTFVDAIIDHAQSSPVTLVINRNMLTPAFAKKLTDAGITIREPEGVVHQKSLSTPDTLFVYTGAYDRKSFESKNDVGVQFTGGLASQYFDFEKLVASHASRFKIQDQLAELASRGIAIDAPHEGVTYAARSYWAMARGAQRDIELHVKELFDPRFFEFLVDRAKAGVKVKISLALEGQESIGKDSEELWQQAKADYPGLPLTVETQPGDPHRRHFNAIFADDFSAVGTLYPWVTAFNKVEPPKGRENMVILGKEGTARLKEEINGLGLATPEPYVPMHPRM